MKYPVIFSNKLIQTTSQKHSIIPTIANTIGVIFHTGSLPITHQIQIRNYRIYMDLVDCFTVQPAPLGAPLGMDWWNSLSGPATEFLPPSWRQAHAHFGFAHRQQPLRWLKPFLKDWYVKLYELIAPHTLKCINSVIKLGHFVWNIIYCLSRIKFKDRWVVFLIYDSFCWTKSPTAAGLGSRNYAM